MMYTETQMQDAYTKLKQLKIVLELAANAQGTLSQSDAGEILFVCHELAEDALRSF